MATDIEQGNKTAPGLAGGCTSKRAAKYFWAGFVLLEGGADG